MQLIIFFNTLRNLQGEKVHICVFFFFPHPCSCHLLTASPSGVVVLARLCGTGLTLVHNATKGPCKTGSRSGVWPPDP